MIALAPKPHNKARSRHISQDAASHRALRWLRLSPGSTSRHDATTGPHDSRSTAIVKDVFSIAVANDRQSPGRYTKLFDECFCGPVFPLQASKRYNQHLLAFGNA